MNSAEALTSEEALLNNPNDLCLRTILLYYYQLMGGSGSDTDGHLSRTHAMWIITNCPESDVAGSFVVHEALVTKADMFSHGTRLWREHVARDSMNARLLANAAAWFEQVNTKVGERWLEQAHRINDKSFEITLRLARWYERRAGQSKITGDGAKAMTYAQNSLRLYESLLSNAKAPVYLEILSNAAGQALRCQRFDKAEALGTELIQASIEFPRGGYDGDAVHRGNIIRGLVALSRGDDPMAKKHLLLAGLTPGSAVLRSFGPDMSLANELLDRGLAQVVVEYLQLCASFWEPATVQVWIAEINAGIRPDFGPNLDRL